MKINSIGFKVKYVTNAFCGNVFGQAFHLDGKNVYNLFGATGARWLA